ncbi:MAG: hypothetical protein K2K21_00465 [Lachnospiraceae bacterium]|nr:hypothetical protein [Lachnospiraceae bacterium]
MSKEVFIPHNNNELYEKMINEHFPGELSLENVWMVWKLPNGITVKVSFDPLHPETYLITYYGEGKREFPLAHWHPYIEDVYRDLSDIASGKIFWVKRKRKMIHLIFPDLPIIMFRDEWEKFSEKKKRKYIFI